MDRNHTYPSIHQEHHVWRLDLLKARKTLKDSNSRIKSSISNSSSAELKIKVKELENMVALQQQAIKERLKTLTKADKVMSNTHNTNQIISQKLFALNNKLREDLIKFDKSLSKLERNLNKVS